MKTRIEDLALLGGMPAFAEAVHVGKPNIGNRARFLEYVGDILDRRWLTNNGLYVQRLEREIAERIGVRNCITMCNGTVALEIAARALGLRGEVIVPSFTFVATAHALQWQEITPVFCDIHPESLTIDVSRVEAMITPRTTGIVGVHLWGRPCDIGGLTEIARRRGIRLIFDAAHAFGCSYNGRMIGNFGDMEVFSFHATKFFNTLEGGAVVTNDDALAAKIRLMKNFGFSGYDNVIYIGTNGKMNEVSAAMGVTGLETLDEFISLNRRNHEAYRRGLDGLPGIALVPYDDRERNNYQYVVLTVDSVLDGISRDLLLRILHAENILARRYFHPGCHRMEPYRSFFPHAGLLLPHTERLAARVLLLPTGTAIGTEEIERICGIVRLAAARGPEIARRLVRIPAEEPGQG